ncbi:MAG: hypothetical protein K1X78_11640 [Verrucomicrobiaceae bacterium]|nr:hypothetical protein [Verrucomicrobiaceae bacterium]
MNITSIAIKFVALRLNSVIILIVENNKTMIAAVSSLLPLDVCLVSLTTQLLTPTRHATTNLGRESRVGRLYAWRARNPELFEARRIAGMKRSARVRENLRRIHQECKDQWKASALKNPKLQATDCHIAAKEWTLKGPDGQIHCFRNLKKFIRDNPGLFDEADLQWKHPEGKPNQAWCRAFQSLSRLRPTCFNRLVEWQGWTWSAETAATPTKTTPNLPRKAAAASPLLAA